MWELDTGNEVRCMDAGVQVDAIAVSGWSPRRLLAVCGTSVKVCERAHTARQQC